jgi:hypothetical protein
MSSPASFDGVPERTTIAERPATMATDQLTKICPKCKTEAPTTAFGNSARNKDGLSSWCKACKKIDSASWYARNKGRRRKVAVAWNAAHVDELKEYRRDYYQANRERLDKLTADWYRRRPEVRRAQAKRRYDKHRKPKLIRKTKAGHKFCSKCKVEKPIAAFGVQRKNKDGLREQCRSCRKAIAAEWYFLHKALARARNDRWKKNNKEARDAYERGYRKKNSKRLRDYAKEWLRRNPEKGYAYSRKWGLAHPDLTALFARNYRARKNRAEGTHTLEDIADIRRLQRDQCAMPNCRKKLNGKGHVDHIVALVSGGSNRRRNLQILCPPCNVRKHAKDQIDFAREIGLLL